MKPKLWSLVACGLIFLTGCTAPARQTTQPSPAPTRPTAAKPKEHDITAELKQKIDKLVTRLAAKDFTTREAADKELRKLLLQDTDSFDLVLSHLKWHLDATPDAESRTRLERIIGPYLEFGITGSLLSKFPDILTHLTSPDVEVRRQLLEKLGESEHPHAVGPLVRFIDDPESAAIRRAAIAALTKMGEPAVRPLVRKLGKNPGLEIDHQMIGMQIAEILVKVGKSSVILLIEVLDHPDPTARAIAAWALGEIRDIRVVKPLIAAAQSDTPGARAAAAKALGRIGDRRALGPLIGLVLNSNSIPVRKEAAWALADFEDSTAVEPLIKALSDADAGVRRAAAYALGRTKDTRAVKSLISHLNDKVGYVRADVAGALGNIADVRAIQPLIKALSDPDAGARESAALSLGAIKNTKAVGPLIKLLSDEALGVRNAAAYALGRIADPRAAEALINTLGDSEWPVRAAAAEALGKIRDARAVKPLVKALDDPTYDVRSESAYALGEIRDPRAIQALIDVLGREDLGREPVVALGVAGTTAVEPLLKVLRNTKSNVRPEAADALGEIADSRAVEPLIMALNDADPDLRREAAVSLGQIRDQRSVQPLGKALYDAESLVSLNAATALSNIRNDAAFQILVAALSHENHNARFAAVWALGRIGDIKAAPHLLNVLVDQNEEVAKEAAESLVMVGKPALELLKNALGEEKDEAKKAKLKEIIEQIEKE